MARPDKAAAVAELSERFTSSSGIVLTEYRGLSVKALKELRRSLGDNATYAVSKNTLTTIAAREAGVPGIEAHLVGPTAIAFVDGDAVVVAKGLRDFARTHPQLVIKGGVLDGKFLEPDEVRKLADLESREVLLAKVAGGMKGILQQAISLIAAPLSKTARLLAALEEAATGEPVADRRRRGAVIPTWPLRTPQSRAIRCRPGRRGGHLGAEQCRTGRRGTEPQRPNWPRLQPAAGAVGTEPAATAATPEATVAAGDSTTAPAAEDN